jgi:hypothetical protein
MMRVTTQNEAGLDPITDARELDALDAASTVFSRQLFRRDSSRLEDARIEYEIRRGGRMRRIDVGDGLRSRLYCSLARAL